MACFIVTPWLIKQKEGMEMVLWVQLVAVHSNIQHEVQSGFYAGEGDYHYAEQTNKKKLQPRNME